MDQRNCQGGCGASLASKQQTAKFCSPRCANRTNSQRLRDKSPGRRGECRRCSAVWFYPSRGGKGTPLCPACSADFKWCNVCKQAVARTQFARESATSDGLGTRCRACTAVKDAKPAARERRRNYPSEARHKYRLSADGLAQMVLDQQGRCAVCDRHIRLVIDHDHDTGAVRGLLCFRCNNGLGMFCDDTELLKEAIAYLTARRDG